MPFTEAGFKRRTYQEWLEHDVALAKELFGENINTSEDTPLGKYIRLNCEDKRDIEEELEDIYFSYNYKTASGSALRRRCAELGVYVSPGVRAQHTVLVTGTAGYTIPVGTAFTTQDRSVLFHTVNAYTIEAGGTVTVTVECDELGEVGNVPAGAIDTLVYTSADISGASDSRQTVIGEDAESDTSLRRKCDAAQNALGSGTSTAILGALYQVDGVNSACVDYNETMTATAELPAKTYHVSVLADHSVADDIAETIFLKAPLGAESYGNNAVSVEDQWGRIHTIRFDWMTEKMIYVYVKFLVDSSWSNESEEDAVEAIVAHINALENATTVYLNDIYTCLKGITGKVNITELKTSATGFDSLDTADIAVGATEIAKTAAALIQIEAVSV